MDNFDLPPGTYEWRVSAWIVLGMQVPLQGEALRLLCQADCSRMGLSENPERNCTPRSGTFVRVHRQSLSRMLLFFAAQPCEGRAWWQHQSAVTVTQSHCLVLQVRDGGGAERRDVAKNGHSSRSPALAGHPH